MHNKQTHWWWLMAAWALALVSTLSALFLGEVMGMTPCVLCWYQRIFMFPLAIILGIAVFAEDRRGALYALPFAVGGITLAGYHSALIAGWVPQWWVPCGSWPPRAASKPWSSWTTSRFPGYRWLPSSPSPPP
jgi:disulfide bond formation protein DsbB